MFSPAHLAVDYRRPLCPFCGGEVRSSVEVRDALADVTQLERVIRDLSTSEDLADQEFVRNALAEIARRVPVLEAESRGEHLECARAAAGGTAGGRGKMRVDAELDELEARIAAAKA
jgi:hypothetical protein